MSVVISAVFDDVDTADFALAGLRRVGVTVEAYRVRPVDGEASGARDAPGALGAAVGLSGQSSNLTASTPVSVPGTPVPALGGVIGGGLRGGGSADAPDLRDDARSREVIALATVAEYQAADAQGILVSAGGRQVHQIR